MRHFSQYSEIDPRCNHNFSSKHSCISCQKSFCPNCTKTNQHVCQKDIKNDVKNDSKPVKHSDDFKIVVILDESGSMENIRQDMIKALNDLIKEQKQLDRPCKFTLIKFNDNVKKVIENQNLKQIKNLSIEDYRPERSTALYDAIGYTIECFRYETNVLLVIITDGLENASTKYNKKTIFDMLDEKKKIS